MRRGYDRCRCVHRFLLVLPGLPVGRALTVLASDCSAHQSAAKPRPVESASHSYGFPVKSRWASSTPPVEQCSRFEEDSLEQAALSAACSCVSPCTGERSTKAGRTAATSSGGTMKGSLV